MTTSDVLDGWAVGPFTAAGLTHDVYRKGTGPGVVVIHEVPGITPAVARFADEVVDSGFTVAMPSLVGTPGRDVTNGYGLRSMATMCVAREFAAWATGRTAPVISWLRAVAANLHQEAGGAGVGAVGMCFSGGFALGMMVDDRMLAPVLSQPSLPVAIGSKRRGRDVHLSDDDLAAVVERASAGCQVLGLRYVDDPLIGDRFDTLRSLLGESFVAVDLPSPTKRHHSVLTEHRDEASVAQVLAFLRDRLL
jgi:dienelactone hydrolase